MTLLRLIGWSLLLLSAALGVQAHVASTGFLSLQIDGTRVHGALELSVRDAEIAVGLDRNRDGKVSWGEVRAAQGDFAYYVRRHLHLTGSEGACALSFGSVQINERVDGYYLWEPFTADCPAAMHQLTIDYRLLDARGSFAPRTADLKRSEYCTDRRARRRACACRPSI